MRANVFLIFVAIGIGAGAASFGYGGVFLMIYGIGLAGLAWGAVMSILRRDREPPQFMPDRRQPSRIL